MFRKLLIEAAEQEPDQGREPRGQGAARRPQRGRGRGHQRGRRRAVEADRRRLPQPEEPRDHAARRSSSRSTTSTTRRSWRATSTSGRSSSASGATCRSRRRPSASGSSASSASTRARSSTVLSTAAAEMIREQVDALIKVLIKRGEAQASVTSRRREAMDNRFLDLDTPVAHRAPGSERQRPARSPRRTAGRPVRGDRPRARHPDRERRRRSRDPGSSTSCSTRIPGSELIPDSVRRSLVKFIRDTLKEHHGQPAGDRGADAEPLLRGEARALRRRLRAPRRHRVVRGARRAACISLSQAGKIVDVFILTHGAEHFISVDGGIDGDKIRAIRPSTGKPLTIRSVYMMNCVGLEPEPGVARRRRQGSSGSVRNNYLPEPTTYFFWTTGRPARRSRTPSPARTGRRSS